MNVLIAAVTQASVPERMGEFEVSSRESSLSRAREASERT